MEVVFFIEVRKKINSYQRRFVVWKKSMEKVSFNKQWPKIFERSDDIDFFGGS